MSRDGALSPLLSGVDRGKAKVRVPGEASNSTPMPEPDHHDEATGHELVLHGANFHVDDEAEGEDVLEFDLEDEIDGGGVEFLAMARFYSGKKFNMKGLFEEMGVAWGLHTMKPARILGDNRLMLEFDSYEIRRRIVDGGPLRHWGGALLVVEYDGFSPPSAITINSIGIWVQFYNLPDVLRREDHVTKLGARVGQVLKVDMRFPNYVGARVMLPLANALLASMKVHIWGWGDIMVPIHYENVHFFCFIFGRIEHSDKECPDGEVEEVVLKFGVELKASPPKWMREVRIQQCPGAAWFLNFEGAQCARLQEETNSSQRSSIEGRQLVHVFHMARLGEDNGPASSIPPNEECELMWGGKDITVEDADSA
jgi:hypothetical protein